jgi:hypothetical protein
MRSTKKYFVECKTGDRENGSPVMRTWYVNNLLKFTDFLDKQFPDWRYFNVMDKDTRIRIESFTKYRRPSSRQV